MAAKRKLLVIDGATGTPTPIRFLAKNRVGLPLTTKKALREAASVYAAVRRGEMLPEDGAKLSYMARTCGDLAEKADLEPRIEALEARINDLARKLLV